MKTLLLLIFFILQLSPYVTASENSRKVPPNTDFLDATVASGEKMGTFHLEKKGESITLNFSSNSGVEKSVRVSRKNYMFLISEVKKIENESIPFNLDKCPRNSIILVNRQSGLLRSTGACIGSRTPVRHRIVEFIDLLNALI